jgi:hypothetical protein
VLLRVLEEADDLGEFLLGLVDTRHVGKRDLDVRFRVDLGPAAADPHQAAMA